MDSIQLVDACVICCHPYDATREFKPAADRFHTNGRCTVQGKKLGSWQNFGGLKVTLNSTSNKKYCIYFSNHILMEIVQLFTFILKMKADFVVIPHV